MTESSVCSMLRLRCLQCQSEQHSCPFLMIIRPVTGQALELSTSAAANQGSIAGIAPSRQHLSGEESGQHSAACARQLALPMVQQVIIGPCFSSTFLDADLCALPLSELHL